MLACWGMTSGMTPAVRARRWRVGLPSALRVGYPPALPRSNPHSQHPKVLDGPGSGMAGCWPGNPNPTSTCAADSPEHDAYNVLRGSEGHRELKSSHGRTC